jgi:hypothetical protein
MKRTTVRTVYISLVTGQKQLTGSDLYWYNNVPLHLESNCRASKSAVTVATRVRVTHCSKTTLIVARKQFVGFKSRLILTHVHCIKAKVTLEQARKAQRGSRGIALLFL